MFGKKKGAPVKERAQWIEEMTKIARPVLDGCAAGTLKESFALRGEADPEGACLAACARTLAGLAPWLEQEPQRGEEAVQGDLRKKARAAIAALVRPESPSFCPGFTGGFEPESKLSELAWLAFALLEAPVQLAEKLDADTHAALCAYIAQAKFIRPPAYSSALIYGAVMEEAVALLTGDCETQNLDYAMTNLMEFDKGDGVYGDGPLMKWNYDNSLYVHPMLELVSATLFPWFRHRALKWRRTVCHNLKRYAAIQQRMIAPDGSFPVLGGDMDCRMGAFHALAHAVWRGCLPAGTQPGAVRACLDRVIHKCMDAPGTFGPDGLLTHGLCGAQPGLKGAEDTEGHPYLCVTAFVPLGLPANHPFWTAPTATTAWEAVWTGQDTQLDSYH